MWRLLLFLNTFLLCLHLHRVYSAPESDLVDLSKLPELPNNVSDTIYSGYLNVTSTRKYHYVFVESRRNPISDPIILWLNGGPLCSSLMGLVYEHGPFVLDDGETAFHRNQYSWNEAANVIYLESPAGVGYSYAGTEQDQYWDDKNTTADSLAAMLIWYSLFPEYKENEFYISGESYAGVYVPYLAVYIHNHNMNTSAVNDTKINLKGIAVGNACTNYNYDCDPSDWDVYYNFNMYSSKMREDYLRECPANDYFDPVSPQCSKIYKDIKSVMAYVNKYDFNRKCYYNATESKDFDNGMGVESRPRKRYANFLNDLIKKRYPELKPVFDGPDCTDMVGGERWLNLEATRQALHIMPEVGRFVSCSTSGYYNVDFANASYWAYPILVQHGYKIMVYSGDTDGIVPTLGSIRWIRHLRKELGLSVLQPWKQWHYILPEETGIAGEQFAGFIEISQGITLVTVHGVGHLVPQWARDRALIMINNFIHNLPF